MSLALDLSNSEYYKWMAVVRVVMNIWFQSNTGIFVLFGSEEEFCFAEQTW
jgi:hypothetical protein